MHLSKLLPAAFLAASLPTAIAEWCIAIGYHNVNMGGGVRLGGTSSTYDRLEIYNENGDEIFEISDDWNEGVCTDLYRVHAADMGLADDFVWAASCKAPGHILYVTRYLSFFDSLVTSANIIN